MASLPGKSTNAAQSGQSGKQQESILRGQQTPPTAAEFQAAALPLDSGS
jgi:hypothetical protein